MVTDNFVEHERLKNKLRKEFDRLKITDEETRNTLTTEMNHLASILIEAYMKNPIRN